MNTKVKVIIDDKVTKALADIQEPDEFHLILDGLERLNNFIFDHDDEADVKVDLLFAVNNMRRHFCNLNAQG